MRLEVGERYGSDTNHQKRYSWKMMDMEQGLVAELGSAAAGVSGQQGLDN